MSQMTEQDLIRLDREGELIKHTFARLLETFPSDAQSITGMSHWLSAGKTTCQRIVEAIIKPTTGIETLQKLPSPSGLENFLQIAAERSARPDLIKVCQQSNEKFAKIITAHAKSHAAFKKELQNKIATGGSSLPQHEKRKKAFETIASLLGEQVSTKVTIAIHRENSENSKFIHQFILDYNGGYVLGKNSRPMQFKNISAEDERDISFQGFIDDHENYDRELPPFCYLSEFSSPEAIEAARKSHSSFNLISYPHPSKTNGRPLDICAFKSYPLDLLNPTHGGTLAGLIGAPIIFPTKKLCFLAFLERQLAVKSIANLGTYSTTHVATSPEQLWYDRFYNHAGLTVLHPQTNPGDALGYPKLNQLIAAAFKLSGSDPEDFYGYLVDTDYPLWSTVYRMIFPTA